MRMGGSGRDEVGARSRPGVRTVGFALAIFLLAVGFTRCEQGDSEVVARSVPIADQAAIETCCASHITGRLDHRSMGVRDVKPGTGSVTWDGEGNYVVSGRATHHLNQANYNGRAAAPIPASCRVSTCGWRMRACM